MFARIAVLPGDGIGPEVTREAVRVLEAVGDRFGHTFEFAHSEIGGQAIEKHGVPLPDSTVETCSSSDAILLGAVGDPRWDDPNLTIRPEQGLLQIRKHFDLFGNLRPIKLFPGLEDASPVKKDVVAGVDFIIVRELTGGLYFGRPSRRWQTASGRRAVDTLRYSDREIERVMRLAFDMARERRRLVTLVHKANVLSTSRLWREVAEEVARDYPEVTYEDMLVDTTSMRIVRNPRHFDVLVTENTFGDILTDEASVLSGSMGMLPSASLGERRRATASGSSGQRFGMYEPIHGSAPKYAGQGVANPIATILSAAMLLRYSLALHQEAAAVEQAVLAVLQAGHRTRDIAEPGQVPLSTSEMGQLVAAEVRRS